LSAARFELHVAAPATSPAGTLSPPDLTQAPQLTLEQWASTSDLAWGCVRGDVSHWSADATELAQSKLTALASSTLARLGSTSPGLHVTATKNGPLTIEVSLESDGAARARTLLAFTSDPPRAHACVVVCADAARCGSELAAAHPTGELRPPPPPGVALHALAATVHHPHAALGVLAGAVFFAAALAVATRPRPPRRRG
jgi:hypothetical protein